MGRIFEEVLRGISASAGSEKHFSRQLVAVMGRRLPPEAVREVRTWLYLRQFFYLVRGDRERSYLQGLLDQDGRTDWLAQERNEPESTVRAGCAQALKELVAAIEDEFDNDEIIERTDGVWDLARLKDI